LAKKLLFLWTAFILVLAGCDMYNSPLQPFIEKAAGIVAARDYTIITEHYRSDSLDFVAIPAGKKTIIHVSLYNPRRYDLDFSLNGAEASFGRITVDKNRDLAIVIINAPAHDIFFDLTLSVRSTAVGRDIPSYTLPRLRTLSLDTSLASLSIMGFKLFPDFSPAHTNYILYLPAMPSAGTVTLNAVPVSAYSSIAVSGGGEQIPAGIPVPVFPGAQIEIRVTAASGQTRLYRIMVQVGNVPPLYTLAGDFVFEADSGTIITSIGQWGFPLVIPSVINGQPVTAIGPGAFEFADIPAVTIPPSVTHIGANAFSGAPLTQIIIPHDVIIEGQGSPIGSPWDRFIFFYNSSYQLFGGTFITIGNTWVIQ